MLSRIPPGTPLEVAVWTALLTVKEGSVVTYKELARRAGYPKAIRAVASAVGRNPSPITIPCHRVIRSDGSLGNYTPNGGAQRKLQLLRDEGVTQSFV
jgi:O-6-methylguanine DNA methyltransferase